MKRRAFCLAAVPALAWMTSSRAQTKPILIGWLSINSRESAATLNTLKEGLAALGWKEGSQIIFEERWANGRLDRLTPLAEELAAKKPAIIVTASVAAVAAAAKAAPQTPIVQSSGGDLVMGRFAKTLARPGGMVTGLTNRPVDLTEKYVELAMAASPKLQSIGFLLDATSPSRPQILETARRAAARYSVEPRIAEAANSDEIVPALSRLTKMGAQALVITSSGMLSTERRRIAKIALDQRWPLIAGSGSAATGWAESGALLSYGDDVLARYRRAAYYVDRILKGTKPGDLPIEQPTRFELVINMKTAKALGLTIPQDLILRADRVIE